MTNGEEDREDPTKYLEKARETLVYLRNTGQTPTKTTRDLLGTYIDASAGDVEAAAVIAERDVDADWGVSTASMLEPFYDLANPFPSDGALVSAFTEHFNRIPTAHELNEIKETLKLTRDFLEDPHL